MAFDESEEPAEEQLIHFRGALRLGISREKIEEMITHLAHYAGWPVAIGAVRSLTAVVEELDAEAAEQSRRF